MIFSSLLQTLLTISMAGVAISKLRISKIQAYEYAILFWWLLAIVYYWYYAILFGGGTGKPNKRSWYQSYIYYEVDLWDRIKKFLYALSIFCILCIHTNLYVQFVFYMCLSSNLHAKNYSKNLLEFVRKYSLPF